GAVAWIESGGMPENFKFQVFGAKRMIGLANKPVDKTSFGSVAAQIRVAAVTFGLDPSELTTRDQLELATCLMEDDFNLRVTANYLRDLILYDYPDVATLYMTDEQYIMAGVRYNRGVQRRLDDFIRLIRNLPKRGTEDYNYISYGMRLLEIREHIRTLLRE
ncbi:TPA: type VI secretion system tube protein Hcp, partial [Citrobacter freundii]|nr:type VI secretion system tube protein Hcp [Citrobacter freundii]HCB2472407.1 type VI secretion system tube protein Hcp [Citrobacter freundii]HDQ2970323.1 type VI secretion system tube protein Hcp [Citrobacter freundii]HEG1963942.1 type VI secretion system tube protein Hcp [Citrobacter freundii]